MKKGNVQSFCAGFGSVCIDGRHSGGKVRGSWGKGAFSTPLKLYHVGAVSTFLRIPDISLEQKDLAKGHSPFCSENVRNCLTSKGKGEINHLRKVSASLIETSTATELSDVCVEQIPSC